MIKEGFAGSRAGLEGSGLRRAGGIQVGGSSEWRGGPSVAGSCEALVKELMQMALVGSDGVSLEY